MEGNKKPLVSIMIATYNRKDELHNALLSIKQQTYPFIEILVLNDNSKDETRKIMIEEFPEVQYIELPENLGISFARNVLMASAKGKYVVSLDDDARFIRDDAIEKMVQCFESHPEVGIVMFNVYTPDTDEPKIPKHDGWYISYHIACACGFHRSIIETAGYYRLFFRTFSEEWDLTLRVLNSGLWIYFEPKIVVFHNFKPTKRSKYWHRSSRFHAVRNDLSVILLQFPFLVVFPALLWNAWNHLRFGIKQKLLLPTFIGYAAFILRAPKLLRYRKPVNLQILKLFYVLRDNRLSERNEIECMVSRMSLWKIWINSIRKKQSK